MRCVLLCALPLLLCCVGALADTHVGYAAVGSRIDVGVCCCVRVVDVVDCADRCLAVLFVRCC